MQALAAKDIGSSIGHHYPASGRNNATQLFSGRYVDHQHADVARLASLAHAGAADAVQLELGIPLRWPGPRRKVFLDALTDVLHMDLAWRTRSSDESGGAVPRCPRSECGHTLIQVSLCQEALSHPLEGLKAPSFFEVLITNRFE